MPNRNLSQNMGKNLVSFFYFASPLTMIEYNCGDHPLLSLSLSILQAWYPRDARQVSTGNHGEFFSYFPCIHLWVTMKSQNFLLFVSLPFLSSRSFASGNLLNDCKWNNSFPLRIWRCQFRKNSRLSRWKKRIFEKKTTCTQKGIEKGFALKKMRLKPAVYLCIRMATRFNESRPGFHRLALLKASAGTRLW